MSHSTLRSRALFGLSALLLAGSMGAATTAQAAAPPRDGTCTTGEFCYYYSPNQAGGVSDFTTSVPGLGTNPATCETFISRGPGHGQCVRNNAASVWNRTSQPVTVHYTINYRGAYQTIAPGAKATLNANLRNNNAAHRIGTAAAPAPAPTTSTVGGKISRAEIIKRAEDWLNHDPKLEYSQSGWAGDLQGRKYRTDCSGFVSMALHTRTSYSTVTLPQIAYRINWSQLSPGDIVGTLGSGTGGNGGHVVLFKKWDNAEKTRFTAIEFSGSRDDMKISHRSIKETRGGVAYLPYRYTNVVG